MKTLKRVIIGFVIGILFLISGIAMGGFEHFTIFAMPSLQIAANRIDDIHFTNTNNVQTIKLELNNADVDFIESDDENIEIDAKQIYNKFRIYREDNCIIVKQPHYFINKAKASVSIYVPKNTLLKQIKVEVGAGTVRMNELNAQNIKLETGAGSLKVDKIETNQLSVKTGMGDTKIKQALCDQLDIDLGMGDVKVGLQNKIEEYGYNVSVGLGNVDLGNNKFSGAAQERFRYQSKDKKIDIDCGMGNVSISEMEED